MVVKHKQIKLSKGRYARVGVVRAIIHPVLATTAEDVGSKFGSEESV